MGTDVAAASDFTCVVCGQPASFTMSSECNWCDGRYHLNQRNDVEAKDCGAVWIDEQYLALQFACNNCLAANGLTPPGAPTAERAPGPPTARRRYRRRE
jgi:hypothetical protein